MTIVLVEDDNYYRQLVKEYLEDNGCECVRVGTSHEAVKVDLRQYSGAVVDVMLPNEPGKSGITEQESRGGLLTGVAVTRRLRRKVAEFPIVLLSAGVAGGEAQRWAQENHIPLVFKDENRGRILSALAELGLSMPKRGARIFIVHGHDQNYY